MNFRRNNIPKSWKWYDVCIRCWCLEFGHTVAHVFDLKNCRSGAHNSRVFPCVWCWESTLGVPVGELEIQMCHNLCINHGPTLPWLVTKCCIKQTFSTGIPLSQVPDLWCQPLQIWTSWKFHWRDKQSKPTALCSQTTITLTEPTLGPLDVFDWEDVTYLLL